MTSRGKSHPVRGKSTARQTALWVLGDMREGRRTARESLQALVDAAGLVDEDRGLCLELVMGVVRHRLTLVAALRDLTPRGWQRVNRQLQDVLLLGAYQLIWLDRIPAFAAINESVELAKARGGVRTGRFVNAVLRQLERDLEPETQRLKEANPRRAIAVDRENCRVLTRDVFDDPADNQVEFLSQSYSVPSWLVKRWIHTHGLASTTKICRAATLRPPTFLRANRLRVDPDTLMKQLRHEGVQVRALPDGQACVVEDGRAWTQTRAFAQGWLQAQDRSAMNVALRMQPVAGEVIVDLCAGLGTKTTQMAELMEDQGTVLAVDKDVVKLEALKTNAERLGLTCIRTVALDAIADALQETGPPNWILVDAPCSNSGVLARRPEARYRIGDASLKKLANVQFSLLERAAALAGPDTWIAYSTCSIEPEENEQVVTRFIQAHAGWRVVETHLALPSAGNDDIAWRDGAFWAMLVREFKR